MELARCCFERHPGQAAAHQYGRGWFATYNTVGVRKAMEDQAQALLSNRVKPAEAAERAQRAADALLRPYVEQTALKTP